MTAQTFWISTGDIREPYRSLNIVSSYVEVAQPAFGSPDRAAGVKKAIDQLAHAAMNAGGNGVIWIDVQLTMFSNLSGVAIFATGTAVTVTPEG